MGSPAATPSPIPAVAAAIHPATRPEYVTVIAHYHRAEIARMAGWRDRIDRTTNWAITVVAAMLSVSLSTPSSHHSVLVFGMLVVQLLLSIEARRYRYFDVYRRRVRKLERNYFAPVFAPSEVPDMPWTQAFAEDLRRPNFLVNRRQAMARRLKRNYIWLFLILLFAWTVKISSAKLQALPDDAETSLSIAEWVRNAALGPLPGWAVVAAVAAFYAWIFLSALGAFKGEGELAYGPVHV